jgi:DNA-binding MarR family transcriptional regulator
MTNRLDGLEKAGLIRREHAKDDRRSILLSLTKKGREATQRANAARESISAKLLPGLSVKDRKALVAILRRMLVEFEASSKSAA